jgi:hypothetical protein
MSAAWVWTIAGLAVAAVVLLAGSWLLFRRGSVGSWRLRRYGRYYKSASVGYFPDVLDRRRRLIWDDEAVSRAIGDSIKTGLLMFNPTTEMIQGQEEKVEVGIGPSTGLREALVSDLHGRGEPQFKEIDTSLYMEVKLSGSAFEITSPSPPEQLIVPTPARWEFDVLPCRAGRQTMTLSVNLRIEAEGVVGGRRGVSVLRKEIHIQVKISYATRRFVTNNWQWLIPAVVALAGTIAAWLVVPF